MNNHKPVIWLCTFLVILSMMILFKQSQIQSNVDLLTKEMQTNHAINSKFIRSVSDKSSPQPNISPDIQADIINHAPYLQVYPEKCHQMTLWGREHHGGWYICEDNLPSTGCTVYSFGLGADWSFDNEAEKRNCEVHGFDPTNLLWKQGMHGRDFSGFDYAKHYPSKSKKFHNWGIGPITSLYPPGTIPQDWPGLGDPPMSKTNPEPWLIKSLEQTILDLGHNQTKLTILKIDVEGAEWTTLIAALGSPFLLDYLKRGMIEQLLLEYHWDPHSSAQNDRYHQVMLQIEDLGFVPWKIERHKGSDCCLDVSYIWKTKQKS